MKPMNLYSFTQLPSNVDEDIILSYYVHLTNNKLQKMRIIEYNSLQSFVKKMMGKKFQIKELDNFYYSFSIPQISKEFDLLKIGSNGVLNIELKSSLKDYTKIANQLISNRYYLSHFNVKIHSFTFVADTGKVYKLDDKDKLIESDISNVIMFNKSLENIFIGDIYSRFKAANFLVSPLDSWELFLNNKYFLTSQQQEIKEKILKNGMNDFGIHQLTGEAGTGKTLLLYDIAKELSSFGKTCVIHCGILCFGHMEINLNSKINIYAIRSIMNMDYKMEFSKYKYIFFDEAQRIWYKQFNDILEVIDPTKQIIVFSCDKKQTLSSNEEKAKTTLKIENVMGINKHNLTTRIRTNKEIANFISAVFDLKKKNSYQKCDNIEVIYATNPESAIEILISKQREGFRIISYTPSTNGTKEEWRTFPAHANAHEVIGHEYDKVLVSLGNQFFYNENGVLISVAHSYPPYLYDKMLYQAMTRVREKLCMVIYQNFNLFTNIMSIFSENK